MVCCKNFFFWFNVLTFWTSSIVIHHFLNRVHPWSLSQLDAARMADTYRYESYKNGFPILCASDYCAAATAAAAVQPPNRRHRCRRLVHLCVFSRFSASKASSMSTILMYYGADSTWTKVAVTANLLLVNLWGKRVSSCTTNTWEIFDRRSFLQNIFLISAKLNIHWLLVCNTIRNI